MDTLSFYKGKKVLITGHTGFKGSWLSRILIRAGAVVTGYSLEPPTDPSLFHLLKLENEMHSVIGDIRDYDHLLEVVTDAQPEIVLHLAAQPIVRTSYKEPRETFDTNVMGTVNLLEAIRQVDSVKSVLNVTTDKVYLNREVRRGYVEDDPLDGYDPYSNSKSCSDLVTHSYRSSYFLDRGIAVSTARAGNVIGGGDFAVDRIIPDCVRAVSKGEDILLRNPNSIRPYQHVLEPLAAYLLLAKKQYEDPSLQGAYNVGPSEKDAVTTGEIATMFTNAWGENASWSSTSNDGPHEAGLLMLDSSKIRTKLGFTPRWNIEEAIQKTVEWSKVFVNDGDLPAETDREIEEYFYV